MIIRTALVVFCGVTGFATAHAQTVSYEAGDLLVGFHAVSGTGATDTFVFNLGYTVDFRDRVATGELFNLGSILASLYGSNWFDRTDLYWGAAGVRDGRNPFPPFGAKPPVVDGDPSVTVYLSRAATGVQTSQPWQLDTRASLIAAAGNIRGLADLGQQAAGCFRFQPAAPGTDNRGAIIAASGENSWASYNPQPGAGFGIFVGGIETAFGSSTDHSYLDLYRILTSTEGANPAGEEKVGSWIGTLTLDRNGNLAVVYAGELAPWYEDEGLIDLGNSWYELSWFGAFHLSGDFVYTPGSGWWVIESAPQGGLYMYSFLDDKWMYSTKDAYPWVFQYGVDGGWLTLVN